MLLHVINIIEQTGAKQNMTKRLVYADRHNKEYKDTLDEISQEYNSDNDLDYTYDNHHSTSSKSSQFYDTTECNSDSDREGCDDNNNNGDSDNNDGEAIAVFPTEDPTIEVGEPKIFHQSEMNILITGIDRQNRARFPDQHPHVSTHHHQ